MPDDLPANLPTIVITGPTAGGKTALAMALADRFSCQLISVDSSMVYRQLNIGAAKPTSVLLRRYPHELVDIRDIDQSYSAGEFVDDAGRAIKAAVNIGKIPILVGGTLLYLRSLYQGIAALPPANPAIRREIEVEAIANGWASLHDQLADIDPAAAVRINPADRQRIQRALEVYRLTGKPISEWQGSPRHSVALPIPIKLVVAPQTRQVLHAKIAARTRQMLESGLVEEVIALREQGQLEELPAMRAVGYRQVIETFDGKAPIADLADRITIATRQLAKRQLTWLRNDPGGIWLDSESERTISRVCDLVANRLKDLKSGGADYGQQF